MGRLFFTALVVGAVLVPAADTASSRDSATRIVFAASIVGDSQIQVHLERLSDGADAVVAAGTAARFGDAGLFYAYEGPAPWRGRIRFVPFDKLPLR